MPSSPFLTHSIATSALTRSQPGLSTPSLFNSTTTPSSSASNSTGDICIIFRLFRIPHLLPFSSPFLNASLAFPAHRRHVRRSQRVLQLACRKHYVNPPRLETVTRIRRRDFLVEVEIILCCCCFALQPKSGPVLFSVGVPGDVKKAQRGIRLR